MSLHADKVVAAAETYMGLVELVLWIPGGGGLKNWHCVHQIYSTK
jgi:3-hydroxyacyl-CoA dehydrogenase